MVVRLKCSQKFERSASTERSRVALAQLSRGRSWAKRRWFDRREWPEDPVDLVDMDADRAHVADAMGLNHALGYPFADGARGNAESLSYFGLGQPSPVG
jgi:hypothetical protein